MRDNLLLECQIVRKKSFVPVLPFTNLALAVFLLSVVLSIAGCAKKPMDTVLSKPVRVNSVGFRQNPPEGAYNRIRLVHLPQVMPSKDLPSGASKDRIIPIFHISLDNATLEDAAKTLAQAVRYESYCASAIAKKGISIDALGTIDELASQIARQTGIHAVVDHPNKDIRFLAKAGEVTSAKPKFSRY